MGFASWSILDSKSAPLKYWWIQRSKGTGRLGASGMGLCQEYLRFNTLRLDPEQEEKIKFVTSNSMPLKQARKTVAS